MKRIRLKNYMKKRKYGVLMFSVGIHVYMVDSEKEVERREKELGGTLMVDPESEHLNMLDCGEVDVLLKL